MIDYLKLLGGSVLNKPNSSQWVNSVVWFVSLQRPEQIQRGRQPAERCFGHQGENSWDGPSGCKLLSCTGRKLIMRRLKLVSAFSFISVDMKHKTLWVTRILILICCSLLPTCLTCKYWHCSLCSHFMWFRL